MTFHSVLDTLYSVPYEKAVSHVRLFWPTWDYSVPHETTLTHIRHLYPTWDYSFLHETALCHYNTMQSVPNIFFWWLTILSLTPCALSHLSHMGMLCPTLVWPTWDWSDPYDIALSQIRLLWSTWDWSNPHETALYQERLLCPTWDWSDQHETVLTHTYLSALTHMMLLFPI